MKTEVRQDTGYGLIPRKIMRDKNLSLQAKAIYSYLASFAGNTGRAFPSVNLMMAELGMAKGTFYKYIEELREKGAIEVKQERDEGRFARNVYYLNNEIKTPCPKKRDTVKWDTVKWDTIKWDTDIWDSNSNNFNSNNLNSNNTTNNTTNTSDDDIFRKIVQAFEQNGFGTINMTTKEMLVDLIETYTGEWVLDAIEVAVKSNVRRLNYVEGILKRWKVEGKGMERKKEEVDPYAGMEVY